MLAFALAVIGCVRDDWTTVSRRDAGSDTVTSATLDVPPDETGSGCRCCRGASSCGGACVDALAHLYRGEGDAFDSVGSEHATRSNAGFASGHDGQAFTFGGGFARPLQYVTLPPGVLDFDDGDFTVSLWFKSTLHGDLISKRAACWGGLPFTGLDLRLDSAGEVLIDAWTQTHRFEHRTMAGLNDGVWHHVAIVRSGAALSLHVDGVSALTGPLPGLMRDPTNTPVYLGVGRCVAGAPGANINSDGTTWLDGSIDEVAVLHRAMSSAELLDVAQGRCSP